MKVETKIIHDEKRAAEPTATAYTISRDKDGKPIILPPAMSIVTEHKPPMNGHCPNCDMKASGAPVLDFSPKEEHRIYRCSKCGTEFVVTGEIQ